MDLIATTPTTTTTSSPTLAPQPKRARQLFIGLVAAAVLVTGGVAAAVVNHGHGPSTAPGLSPRSSRPGSYGLTGSRARRTLVRTVATTKLQQAVATKRDRLQAEVDTRTTAGETVLSQIHGVTGVGKAAQQARTRLYQECATAERSARGGLGGEQRRRATKTSSCASCLVFGLGTAEDACACVDDPSPP